MNKPSQRPLPIGALRAFEAVARHLGFGAAASELHLTQPAVSRQIRGLEDALGTRLFSRGTRHVELTTAGATLLRAVAPLVDRLDATVRQIRAAGARTPVSLTTFASFASLWLLPRLPDFQAKHPDIDIRISAGDALVSLDDDPELDLALRYYRPAHEPRGAAPLFGEVLTPVAAPALLQRQPLRAPDDLVRHTLLEEDDHRPSAELMSKRHWLDEQAPGVQPHGWLYLNYTYEQI